MSRAKNTANAKKIAFERKQVNGKPNPKYVDVLTEDKPIAGQHWACVSFISPEKILKQKNIFFFEEFLKKWEFNKSMEKFIQFYLFFKEKHYDNKFVFTYEELHTDTLNTIKNLCEFFGYSFTIEQINSAIEYCSFDKMKEREEKLIGTKRAPVYGNPNGYKVRRAVIGGYKDDMSPEDIEYCNNLLTQYDYFNRMQK
mgnify:CR=1 FL=1